jgi:hypothetical protein
MTQAHIDPFAGIPITKLRVFDAAARHKNFVQAGLELGMTQGAVSRHIKSLEAGLGSSLFVRGPRGVSLTEGGDLLADYVRRAFNELATGLQRLGRPRRRATLSVVAPRSFAWRVLAPRIGGFVRQYPWIDLRVDTHRYYANIGHHHRSWRRQLERSRRGAPQYRDGISGLYAIVLHHCPADGAYRRIFPQACAAALC